MLHKGKTLTILSHATIVLGILAIGFPLWVILVASTHTPQALSINPIPLWFGDQLVPNYTELLLYGIQDTGAAPLWLMMTNSLIMALGIAVGKITVSIIAAFAIVYFQFPLRMLFFWLIFITLMLPVEVRILPTFDIVAKLDMLNSYVGLIIPLTASATATFLFRQFFLTIPDELVEAARMDGAGPIRFFLDILIPLSRTNIAALFIVLFIFGWNQYLWPLIITTEEQYETIVMGVRRMVNSGEALPLWHLIMGSVTLGLLPPVLVVVLMQRLFVKGLIETEK